MNRFLALVFILLVPSLSQATLLNGGFETGNFTGWSTIGDALVTDASLGIPPPEGTFQALITNAPGIDDLHPASFSGTPSVDAFSSIIKQSQLEIFLGVPTNSLAQLGQALGLAFGGVPLEGSAIKQSFTADAGQILSFRWNYITNDAPCCDFAFVVLDGTLSLLASGPSPLVASNASFFPNESGYQFFATTLPISGPHSIGVGVVDTTDFSGNSGVLLDSFFVTVPEPPAWLFFAFGVISIMIIRRQLA